MALTDFFRISDFDVRVNNNNQPTAPYPAEKVLALRNFKNDYIRYQQTGLTGNSDLNFIKIGLDRRFKQIYFDLSEPTMLNGVGRSAWFYTKGPGYDFTEFNMSTQVDDETGFLRQSGFLKILEFPSDWRVDQDGLYSVLIWCARQDPTAGESDWRIPLRGLNYVFSDDNDLERIRTDIVESSQGKGWGPKHVLARDYIMQQIRKKFNRKDLTAFDIINPWELREASAFLTTSMIFKYELSTSAGDVYYNLSKSFYEKAMMSFDKYELSIDTNQDGVVDDKDETLVGDDMIGNIGLEWT